MPSVPGNFGSVVTCGYLKYIRGILPFLIPYLVEINSTLSTLALSVKPLTGSSCDDTDVCDLTTMTKITINSGWVTGILPKINLQNSGYFRLTIIILTCI